MEEAKREYTARDDGASAAWQPARGPRTRAGAWVLGRLSQALPPRFEPYVRAALTLNVAGVVCGLAFGFAVLMRCSIAFCGEVDWRGIDANHFASPGVAGVVMAVLAALLMASLASNLGRIARWTARRADVLGRTDRAFGLFAPTRRPPRLGGHGLFLLVWVVVLACWAPVLLSWAPGSVPNDAAWSIAQAMGTRPLNSHHPLFYTLLVKCCMDVALAFGGDCNAGVMIYSVIQSLVLAASVAYLVSWLARHRLPRVVVVATFLYFVACPLFSGYAIIMWKDPLFGAFALLYSLFLLDVALSHGDAMRSAAGVTRFSVLSALLILIRSNGILLVLGAGLFLLVFWRKQLRWALWACGAIAMVVFVGIQWVVPRALPVETEYVESVGVQLQQVAYVVVTEGGVPAEYQELVDGILPAGLWRDAYSPCCVDSLKWNDSFDKDYLSDHRDEFMSMWRHLGASHPVKYVQAYMLNTFGFWTPGSHNYKEMLTLTVSTDEDAAPFGLYSTDLVQQWTGISLRPAYQGIIGPAGSHSYFSGGTLAWVCILAAIALCAVGGKRWLPAMAPSLFGWLSVMIASPAAFGLRYLFVSIICLPLILLLPIWAAKEGAGAQHFR